MSLRRKFVLTVVDAGRTTPHRLPAQTAGLSRGSSARPELLLFGVPSAFDIDVGTLPSQARLSRTGGGADVSPPGPADTSGGASGADARRGTPHAGAVAGLAARAIVPQAPLWRAAAWFMPPVCEAQLPGALIGLFAGPAHEALMRLLVWLGPITVGLPTGCSDHDARGLLSTRRRCT